MINIRESKEYLEFGYKVVRCPICRKETLDNHFICPTCNWEYDDSVVNNDSYYSAVNGYSIKEYKILHGWNI